MIVSLRRRSKLFSRIRRIVTTIDEVSDIVDDFLPLPDEYQEALRVARELGLSTRVRSKSKVHAFLKRKGYK